MGELETEKVRGSFRRSDFLMLHLSTLPLRGGSGAPPPLAGPSLSPQLSEGLTEPHPRVFGLLSLPPLPVTIPSIQAQGQTFLSRCPNLVPWSSQAVFFFLGPFLGLWLCLPLTKGNGE